MGAIVEEVVINGSHIRGGAPTNALLVDVVTAWAAGQLVNFALTKRY